MMKVIGGRLKGRAFKAPPAKPGVRPAVAIIRQAIFDVIGEPEGARVLDLFGCSGSLTIEALSRGAESAVIVEIDRRNAVLISDNLAALGLQSEVICAPAEKAIGRLTGRGFDLIFIDPPFDRDLAAPILEQVLRAGLAAPEAVIIARTSLREKFSPPSLDPGMIREKRYGDSRVYFITA